MIDTLLKNSLITKLSTMTADKKQKEAEEAAANWKK